MCNDGEKILFPALSQIYVGVKIPKIKRMLTLMLNSSFGIFIVDDSFIKYIIGVFPSICISYVYAGV